MLETQTDFKDYECEDVIDDFIDKLENWISLKNVVQVEKNEEAEKYLNLSPSQVRDLTQAEALSGAYCLFNYAHYIQKTLNREKTVLDWASDSIWYIVADKLDNYGSSNGSYSKWEQKYYSAVKENPIARDLMKLKTHCLSRVNMLKGLVDKIEKMAKTLENVARYA